MIIGGQGLRDQLESFPIGTRFKCVGHWDRHHHYYEGVCYTLMYNEVHYPELVCLQDISNHKNYGHRHLKGNGYSGIWELVEPFEDKKLEDYL